MMKSFLALSICMLCITTTIAADNELEPFDDRYCTTCHGTYGKGNEAIQAPRLAGMEAWYLKRQLENYRAGIRGNHAEDIAGIEMQPMAEKLSDESITDIIGWISEWQYVPAEITIDGNTSRGQNLYASCAVCHGANAEGNENLAAPALAGQNDWYLVSQLKNFIAGYRGVHANDIYGAQMFATVGVLESETDILDVVSYINTLSQ